MRQARVGVLAVLVVGTAVWAQIRFFSPIGLVDWMVIFMVVVGVLAGFWFESSHARPHR